MGPMEQDIIKQAVRTGQPIPDRIANAPNLTLGLELYFQAFFDLDSERGIGFGAVSRIPFSSIVEYCRAYDFSMDEMEDLIRIIRDMDLAYIHYFSEKVKIKNESK